MKSGWQLHYMNLHLTFSAVAVAHTHWKHFPNENKAIQQSDTKLYTHLVDKLTGYVQKTF